MSKSLAERVAEKVAFAVERAEESGTTTPPPSTIEFATRMAGTLIDVRGRSQDRRASAPPIQTERVLCMAAEVATDEVDAVANSPATVVTLESTLVDGLRSDWDALLASERAGG